MSHVKDAEWYAEQAKRGLRNGATSPELTLVNAQLASAYASLAVAEQLSRFDAVEGEEAA